MFRRSLLFALFLCLISNIFGQKASIHAIHPDYAEIRVHTSIAWNPFVTISEYSNTLICDENGEFRQDIPLQSPRVVQFETGIYQAYLYVEPGYHYEVELPEYREKDYADQISPFYQPVVVPLKVFSRRSLATKTEIDGTNADRS